MSLFDVEKLCCPGPYLHTKAARQPRTIKPHSHTAILDPKPLTSNNGPTAATTVASAMPTRAGATWLTKPKWLARLMYTETDFISDVISKSTEHAQ
jgi:hypothetical protein